MFSRVGDAGTRQVMREGAEWYFDVPHYFIGAVRVNCTVTVGAAPLYAVGELVVGGPGVGVVVISDDSRFLYLPRFAGDVSPTVTHAERSMAGAPCFISPMDGKPGSCYLGNLD